MPTMQTEPIRIPAWAFTIITAIATVAVTVLEGSLSVQEIVVLIVIQTMGILAPAEVGRRRVDSPETVERLVREAGGGQ